MHLAFDGWAILKLKKLNSYFVHRNFIPLLIVMFVKRIISFLARGKKSKIGNHHFKNFCPLAATSSFRSLMSGVHKMSSSFSIWTKIDTRLNSKTELGWRLTNKSIITGKMTVKATCSWYKAPIMTDYLPEKNQLQEREGDIQ